MSQIQGTALSAERIRRGAWWCLATALVSSLALILPWLGFRDLGILLGLTMIVGGASDVRIERDTAMGTLLSNAAAALACAGFALIARLLIALFA